MIYRGDELLVRGEKIHFSLCILWTLEPIAFIAILSNEYIMFIFFNDLIIVELKIVLFYQIIIMEYRRLYCVNTQRY